MVALMLLAGLASALLVRFSPGTLVDERELDPRMSQESLTALRVKRAAENSLRAGLVQYLKGAMHGDLGESKSRNVPIADLLTEKAPATLRRLGIGFVGAWLAGLGMAILVARFPRAWVVEFATTQMLQAETDAMREVMDQAQPLINDPHRGFKGLLPAVFAYRV